MRKTLVLVLVAIAISVVATLGFVKESAARHQRALRAEIKRQAQVTTQSMAQMYAHTADSQIGFSLAVNSYEHELRVLDSMTTTSADRDLVNYLGKQIPSASACFNLEHMDGIAGAESCTDASSMTQSAVAMIAKM